MMFVITRFFDTGMVKAMLTNEDTYREQNNGGFDQYVESVGEGGDYENLEDWCDEMSIDLEDIEEMVDNSNKEDWIDITAYC